MTLPPKAVLYWIAGSLSVLVIIASIVEVLG